MARRLCRSMLFTLMLVSIAKAGYGRRCGMLARLTAGTEDAGG
jgi:hypothetical protein